MNDPAPYFAATSIALPKYAHSQADLVGYFREWLREEPRKADRAAAILNHSRIDRRYTVHAAEWYLSHTSITERSQAYREAMIDLSEQAVRQALEASEIDAAEIGLIVSTSCTGLMIPSVESHLMNRMNFRPTTCRLPLTELGCVAGAAAVSAAERFLRAEPRSTALVVSTELASLTAQIQDFSMTNIVAASLFGDGSAATVLVGAEHPARATSKARGDRKPRPCRILASRSVLFPDSTDLMGFNNTDSGLQIFLSPNVPRFIRKNLPQWLRPFLEENGLRVADLDHFLLHPGGRKVLEGLQSELGITEAETEISWKVLRDYGNLSSATVLYLLHHFEKEVNPQSGDRGLMMAFGPGFSAEMILLGW